ncbi:hypothetical protein [Nonomuraea sp. NPDC003201]
MPKVVAPVTISRANTDSSAARTTKIYRSDLIVVGDIGLLPLSHKTTEAFYHPIDAAYERHLSPPSTSIPPGSTRSSEDHGHRHRRSPHAPRAHGRDQR